MSADATTERPACPDEGRTIFGLVGGLLLLRSDAIREAAGRRDSLWWGLGLALLAGLVRHHDEHLGRELVRAALLGLLGPLAASVMFFILVPPSKLRAFRFRAFLGPFLLTAPLAFLYGFPAERVWNPLNAVIANAALLGVVAFWRGAVLWQIYRVLFGLGLLEAFARLLLGASVVFFLLGLFGQLGATLALMGGMRDLGAAHRFQQALLGGVLCASFWCGLAALGWLLVVELPRSFLELPRTPAPGAVVRQHRPGRVELALAGALVCAIALLVGWGQRSLSRAEAVRALVRRGQLEQAFDRLRAEGRWAYVGPGVLGPLVVEYVWDRDVTRRPVQALVRRALLDTTGQVPGWVRRDVATSLARGLQDHSIRGRDELLKLHGPALLALARAELADYAPYRVIDADEPISAFLLLALEPSDPETEALLSRFRREHPSAQVRRKLAEQGGN